MQKSLAWQHICCRRCNSGIYLVYLFGVTLNLILLVTSNHNELLRCLTIFVWQMLSILLTLMLTGPQSTKPTPSTARSRPRTWASNPRPRPKNWHSSQVPQAKGIQCPSTSAQGRTLTSLAGAVICKLKWLSATVCHFWTCEPLLIGLLFSAENVTDNYWSQSYSQQDLGS